MSNLPVDVGAVEVKTDDERDTREILKVESVGHQSRRVMTYDRDGSFVSYSFAEIVSFYSQQN